MAPSPSSPSTCCRGSRAPPPHSCSPTSPPSAPPPPFLACWVRASTVPLLFLYLYCSCFLWAPPLQSSVLLGAGHYCTVLVHVLLSSFFGAPHLTPACECMALLQCSAPVQPSRLYRYRPTISLPRCSCCSAWQGTTLFSQSGNLTWLFSSGVPRLLYFGLVRLVLHPYYQFVCSPNPPSLTRVVLHPCVPVPLLSKSILAHASCTAPVLPVPLLSKSVIAHASCTARVLPVPLISNWTHARVFQKSIAFERGLTFSRAVSHSTTVPHLYCQFQWPVLAGVTITCPSCHPAPSASCLTSAGGPRHEACRSFRWSFCASSIACSSS